MANEVVKQETINALELAVQKGLSARDLAPVAKFLTVASAMQELREALTPDIMKPIMALQGSAVGFKTDKDNNGGYPVEVVGNAMIEALMHGVEPVGNKFNIIASRAYITKEGFRFLLKQIKGLKYTENRVGLPVWDGEKSVIVKMKVSWSYLNEDNEMELSFAFKVEKSKFGNITTTDDNTTGKATRKTLKALYERISGVDIPDDDVDGQTAGERAGLDPSSEIKSEPISEVAKTKLDNLINKPQAKEESVKEPVKQESKKEPVKEPKNPVVALAEKIKERKLDPNKFYEKNGLSTDNLAQLQSVLDDEDYFDLCVSNMDLGV